MLLMKFAESTVI